MGKNEANRGRRDGLPKGKKEVAFELNGDSRRVFRVDPARTKWGREGKGEAGGRGGGGGLTRSYLLLRTSDFHWADASYLRSDLTPPLAHRHLDCSTPVSRRRTPDKQWLPYNCFYSSLNAKYSILFLLLDESVVRSSGNRLCK